MYLTYCRGVTASSTLTYGSKTLCGAMRIPVIDVVLLGLGDNLKVT